VHPGYGDPHLGVAEARAPDGGGAAGREQATGTAIGATAVVRALAEGEVNQPGIWLVEQVVPPRPFFERLAAYGLMPTVEAQLEDSRSVPRL
jgi:saccharopine dehydrogenase-like NADP-dependent oxidoreductase